MEIVRNHHERIDGGGYPDGLGGDELSTVVRVTTIADSYDAMTSRRPYRAPLPHEKAVAELRRNKGRRGFEILRAMQSNPDIDIEITEEDFAEVTEVDAKLVHLSQKIGANIITNDFNLNKVAELQGVAVLNINELANAVRPVVVAGEVIQVRVMREGKEANQGVGYLDDGTMVIVEYGRQYVGQTIEVVVTQTLQTTAGRMIFTRTKADGVDNDDTEDVRSYSRGWQRKPNGASSY